MRITRLELFEIDQSKGICNLFKLFGLSDRVNKVIYLRRQAYASYILEINSNQHPFSETYTYPTDYKCRESRPVNHDDITGELPIFALFDIRGLGSDLELRFSGLLNSKPKLAGNDPSPMDCQSHNQSPRAPVLDLTFSFFPFPAFMAFLGL